jgi:LacI family transcriptional regulator
MTLAPESPSVSPTVQRIFQMLKDRILSGTYPTGEWFPTERSLSDEFRVSRILIRAAVRELEREQLISCSAYRRPLVQRPPIVPETLPAIRRNVALWIWPQSNWPGTALVLRGIQEVMGDEFRLILGNMVSNHWNDVPVSEARFLTQLLQDRDSVGVILSYMGGSANLSLLQELRSAHIPMVFIDHLPPEGFGGDYVGVNNRRSAERAVKYLLSLGHRHIAHLSNFDSISTVSERREGYRRALMSAGIPVRDELIRYDPGPSGEDPLEGCETLVRDLLRLPTPPTALFAVNDIAAYRVIAALRAQGCRVPEDISVIGFDGIERWMPTLPFLTTLHQPFEEIGRSSMEMLKDRITNDSIEPYQHTILETRLSIHGSTRVCAP